MTKGIALIGGIMLGLVLISRRSQTRTRPIGPVRRNLAPLPRAQHRHRPALVAPRAPARRKVATFRIEELLEQHVSVDPAGGSYYEVQDEDTVETIARAVLDATGETYTDQNVLDYIYCITSSPWNLRLYGGPSTSMQYPHKWRVQGFAQGIRAAFLHRNADALSLMASGRLPPRTVDEQARPLTDDRSLGLLWLPPVSARHLSDGVVTCAPFSWDDGTSTIAPDPELMELLRAA